MPAPARGLSARVVRRRRAVAIGLAAVLAGGAWLYFGRTGGGGRPDGAGGPREGEPAAPLSAIGCDLPADVLLAVKRGWHPGRSGDVVVIEDYPNLYGNRHSTPWPYTQDVPLVLYGPGFIRSGPATERGVTVADLAPTFAELLGFEDEFGPRDGRVLEEALLPAPERNGVPKLLVTLVWDGVGDNVLERWPRAWPNLKDLMRGGTSYSNAVVGSSPSITPAVHATIGTGDFPAKHGLVDTFFRVGDELVESWPGFSPRYLQSKTLGDMWDLANDNKPVVGVFAREAWHAGRVGHSAALDGGDKDVGVYDSPTTLDFFSDENVFEFPTYIRDLDGLEEAIRLVDGRDGEVDATWLGNPIHSQSGDVRSTSAWPIYQSKKLFELLEGERFGADDVPDLFYTNYKSGDLAGHYWNMDLPEMGAVVKEQDRQLDVLIDGFDRLVGKNNYVLALTADHGMAPFARSIGGWNIEVREVSKDLLERFDKTPQRKLLLANRGYYIWLDRADARANGVTAEDVAKFMRHYTIGDNVSPTNRLTKGFEDNRDDPVYATALTASELDRALACAR